MTLGILGVVSKGDVLEKRFKRIWRTVLNGLKDGYVEVV